MNVWHSCYQHHHTPKPVSFETKIVLLKYRLEVERSKGKHRITQYVFSSLLNVMNCIT